MKFNTKTKPNSKTDSNFSFHALTLIIVFFLLIPAFALVVIALSDFSTDWQHLATYVIPNSISITLQVLIGVAITTSFFGVLTAWLVSSFAFPFRGFVSWALILPLAIPTYLAAYAFGEFFDFTGPVQTLIKYLFGYRLSSEYWFFDIRSTGGAIFVLSSVLYPYVYLTSRTLFSMQGRSTAEAARTLGQSPLKVFLTIQLPMARPAVIIGVTLALMEALNDIGAVEYLGVQTLTFAIYDTWLNRENLVGAAQIACIMFVIVVLLIGLERWGRRNQKISTSHEQTQKILNADANLKKFKQYLILVFCLVPFIAGFVIPLFVIGHLAVKRYDLFFEYDLLNALGNSLFVSIFTAALTVLLAFIIVYSTRVGKSKLLRLPSKIAALGYAMPGTVLALGVLIPFAAFDNYVDGVSRQYFGFATGLLLTGSGMAVIYACSIRFMTIAEGTLDSGFQKLSPNLELAARTLGRTKYQAMRTIIIPLIRPVALTAALLVFIDTMKELPATLLLRPFDFDTLATHIYTLASAGHIEDASAAAIIIILTGTIPVIIISRSLRNGS